MSDFYYKRNFWLNYLIIKGINGEKFVNYLKEHLPYIFNVQGIARILEFAGKDVTPLLDYLKYLISLAEKPEKSVERPSIPKEYLVLNDHIVKYNYKISSFYFGSNFYAEDNVIHKLKDSEIIISGYILDTNTGLVQNPANLEGRFPEICKNEFKNERLLVEKDNNVTRIFVASRKELELVDDYLEIHEFPTREILKLDKHGVLIAANFQKTTNVKVKDLIIHNAIYPDEIPVSKNNTRPTGKKTRPFTKEEQLRIDEIKKKIKKERISNTNVISKQLKEAPVH